MTTAAKSTGQAIVPGTETHFTPPAGEKPKRKRGPSKKTREALEAAHEQGRQQGIDEGRPPMLGVLGIFVLGFVFGTLFGWLVL